MLRIGIELLWYNVHIQCHVYHKSSNVYTIKVLFMHNSLYLMDLRLIVGILVVVDLFILIMQLGELMNYS